VPYLLKYAVTPDWGVLLGGDSWDYQRDAGGNRISGFGDTQIEVKHRIPVNDATAFGVELGLRVPTARSDLGSGRTDYIANGILSTDLGPVHLDLNAGPTWLGRPESGTGRVEWDWAAAASRGVLPDLNFAAELSGSARDDAPSSTRFLTAFAYSLSPRAVIDAGVSWGLGNIRGHTLFTGLTVLLGTLR
jgi:hypothetical protein